MLIGFERCALNTVFGNVAVPPPEALLLVPDPEVFDNLNLLEFIDALFDDLLVSLFLGE